VIFGCPGTSEFPSIVVNLKDISPARFEMGPVAARGRLGMPEDIGKAVVFPAAADYITGTIMHVDGGYVAVRSTVKFKNMRGD
jgi:NAD(P)-dependent dehydrogenase (short-subunit alcohol dehydrogenase family)